MDQIDATASQGLDTAAPEATPRLGDLSMRYETGFTPGHEAQAAATVSSGVDDPGGVSYGAYQFASSPGGGQQVQAFLRHEGAPWAARFAGEDPTQPGGAFGQAWRAVAASEPQAFFDAQHAYTERTHYDPVVAAVLRDTGLDIGQRSRAVQNVVWSMAVQHGRAASLITDAANAVGQQGTQPDIDDDRRLINQLYDTRNAYVRSIGLPNLQTRYAAERADALAELGSS